MKFRVEKEVFDQLPDVCFGVVVAKNINNNQAYPEINKLLMENIQIAAQHFEGNKVKQDERILPYREAFRTIGINPNKYLCSIEALFTRIAKGKGLSSINPIVDLGNALSLKYTLPLGAHDLDKSSEDICIRFSKEGDTFLPFGKEQEEKPDIGEVIYAVGNEVRTRRWTWRQSEHGKITNDSKDIFFPIDGFLNFNKTQIIEARNELSDLLKEYFKCETIIGFVDKEHPEIEI